MHLHTEFFRNLVKSNWNQIVLTIFRLIWIQTDVRLLFQIYRTMGSTFGFQFDLTRFRKKMSLVCTLDIREDIKNSTTVRGFFIKKKLYNGVPIEAPHKLLCTVLLMWCSNGFRGEGCLNWAARMPQVPNTAIRHLDCCTFVQSGKGNISPRKKTTQFSHFSSLLMHKTVVRRIPPG